MAPHLKKCGVDGIDAYAKLQRQRELRNIRRGGCLPAGQTGKPCLFFVTLHTKLPHHQASLPQHFVHKYASCYGYV